MSVVGECSRCGGRTVGGWEGKAIGAKIRVMRDCCLQTELLDGNWEASRDHPAIVEFTAQQADIVWGSHHPYVLCRECHDEFIHFLRSFLGLEKE